MLWALIVSIIFKIQMRASHTDVKSVPDFEHTHGFYELESIRMQQYLSAMDKKVDSAIARHKTANETMNRMALLGKTQNVQNRAFLRLLASDNRVLRARKLASIAKQDLDTINNIKRSTNEFIDIAYDLAYRNKIDVLKQKLLNTHEK